MLQSINDFKVGIVLKVIKLEGNISGICTIENRGERYWFCFSIIGFETSEEAKTFVLILHIVLQTICVSDIIPYCYLSHCLSGFPTVPGLIVLGGVGVSGKGLT